MSVFRYTAIPVAGIATRAELRRGELAGESASEVRASLRRIGLQVIDLRAVRSRGGAGGEAALGPWRAYLRNRRLPERAELYDSLSTLLASGLPLVAALETVLEGSRDRRRALRTLALELREEIRSGASLAHAMRSHPTWFESAEIAMVEAAEHAGTLSHVLRTLSDRGERASELGQKLVGALTYPAIVTVVGIAAVLFLSTKTLPELARILTDAKVEVPALTARVIALGQGAVRYGPWIVAGVLAALPLGFAARSAMARSRLTFPRALRRLSPVLRRRMAVASFARGMAELIRSGVPAVEALRVLAPTARSVGLRRALETAANRAERGDELSAALDDRDWFDPEFRRLLEIGQASGELDGLLDRLGERQERQARRAIDRLAELLEPAAILVLAALIGVVVMAAILPMIRLQEVLR